MARKGEGPSPERGILGRRTAGSLRRGSEGLRVRVSPMQVEVDPVPTEPEREAIEAALEAVAAELVHPPDPGRWWRRGVAENLRPDED